MAKLTVTGNIASIPELTITPNGKAVTKFSLAEKVRLRGPDGQWRDGDPNWFRHLSTDQRPHRQARGSCRRAAARCGPGHGGDEVAGRLGRSGPTRWHGAVRNELRTAGDTAKEAHETRTASDLADPRNLRRTSARSSRRSPKPNSPGSSASPRRDCAKSTAPKLRPNVRPSREA